MYSMYVYCLVRSNPGSVSGEGDEGRLGGSNLLSTSSGLSKTPGQADKHYVFQSTCNS